MTDEGLDAAVDHFLDGATGIYGEYEQGYMDADAALTALKRHVEELRAAAEDAGDADR